MSVRREKNKRLYVAQRGVDGRILRIITSVASADELLTDLVRRGMSAVLLRKVHLNLNFYPISAIAERPDLAKAIDEWNGVEEVNRTEDWLIESGYIQPTPDYIARQQEAEKSAKK